MEVCFSALCRVNVGDQNIRVVSPVPHSTTWLHSRHVRRPDRQVWTLTLTLTLVPLLLRGNLIVLLKHKKLLHEINKSELVCFHHIFTHLSGHSISCDLEIRMWKTGSRHSGTRLQRSIENVLLVLVDVTKNRYIFCIVNANDITTNSVWMDPWFTFSNGYPDRETPR